MGFKHLEIEVADRVATLWLNRPDKLNALSEDMWADIPAAVGDLEGDDGVRVIVLAGRGKAFSVGIDLDMLVSLRPQASSAAAAGKQVYSDVKRLQGSVSCLADAAKPVIAAVHGYCLGGAMSLISACDIRLAARDAVFAITETKRGLVADIGALQRLPGIIGSGATSEMALTGAEYDADWAAGHGLVNRVYPVDGLLEGASELAAAIAANSPLVTQGIKRVLAANDGRTLDQALEYVAQWNSSFLLSNDLVEAMTAFVEKRDPDYTGS